MEKQGSLEITLFILFQGIIFVMFFISNNSHISISERSYAEKAYLPIAWVELLVFTYLPYTRHGMLRSLSSWKGFIVMAAVIFSWIYAIEIIVPGTSVSYIFMNLFVYVCFYELNFRLVFIEVIGKRTGMETSSILSAITYTVFFSLFLYEYILGYPGIYSFYFVIDTFSTGLILSAVYYFTKSVYFTIPITFSLFMIGVIPYSGDLIRYLFIP